MDSQHNRCEFWHISFRWICQVNAPRNCWWWGRSRSFGWWRFSSCWNHWWSSRSPRTTWWRVGWMLVKFNQCTQMGAWSVEPKSPRSFWKTRPGPFFGTLMHLDLVASSGLANNMLRLWRKSDECWDVCINLEFLGHFGDVSLFLNVFLMIFTEFFCMRWLWWQQRNSSFCCHLCPLPPGRINLHHTCLWKLAMEAGNCRLIVSEKRISPMAFISQGNLTKCLKKLHFPPLDQKSVGLSQALFYIARDLGVVTMYHLNR